MDLDVDACEDDDVPAHVVFDDDKKPKRLRKLTDQQRLICTPFVRGYSLKDKKWLMFFVNGVSDITFNEGAFSALKLPNNQKDLILGFTSAKHLHGNQFDDVIEGKGKGIIILLSGPPGVGKTLTAESVAEQMKVPLYVMAAGDLGLDPSRVENKLGHVMSICSRWGAILLLDEADVFLEQRDLHELERNKLVSIFLRVLEYCKSFACRKHPSSRSIWNLTNNTCQQTRASCFSLQTACRFSTRRSNRAFTSH